MSPCPWSVNKNEPGDLIYTCSLLNCSSQGKWRLLICRVFSPIEHPMAEVSRNKDLYDLALFWFNTPLVSQGLKKSTWPVKLNHTQYTPELTKILEPQKLVVWVDSPFSSWGYDVHVPAVIFRRGILKFLWEMLDHLECVESFSYSWCFRNPGPKTTWGLVVYPIISMLWDTSQFGISEPSTVEPYNNHPNGGGFLITGFLKHQRSVSAASQVALRNIRRCFEGWSNLSYGLGKLSGWMDGWMLVVLIRPNLPLLYIYIHILGDELYYSGKNYTQL